MAGGTPLVVSSQAKVLRGLTYVVDPARLGQPVLRPVLDYWERKRDGQALPRRGDIDPFELKPYLRHLFLIEVLPDEQFRYRLVGSEITERYGSNSTGKTVHEIYAAQPGVGQWVTQMLLAVARSARPVLASGPLTAVNKEHILSESLHLPLADEGDRVGMIFGAARYTRVSPHRGV